MTADHAARVPPPIPVSVLTGFLGAGKTSLLNRLLKSHDLSQTAVIINEFGEVGLDHLLVEHVDDDIVLLSTGCLCCTLRGDLIDALERLLRSLDNGRAVFSRVIIETTGLADPAPVLHVLMTHPYLAMRYRLDGIVTVVDAITGAATLDTYAEAVKQVAVADRLVLTKTDLIPAACQPPLAQGNRIWPAHAVPPLPACGDRDGVRRPRGKRNFAIQSLGRGPLTRNLRDERANSSLSPQAGRGEGGAHMRLPCPQAGEGRVTADRASLDALRTRLHVLNPAAPVLDAAAGEADASRMLNCGLYDPASKIPDVKRWLAVEAYADSDHRHGHDHDRNRHDAHIRAFALTTPQAIPAGAFEMFMDLVRSLHGPNLLRVKGVVKLAEHPDQPVVVHVVQHLMHPAARLERWPDEERVTRMVFIVRDVDPRVITELFNALLGPVAPDRADRAAIADNPLVPFGGVDR